MASVLPETVPKLFTAETLKSAAKQSQKIVLVPHRLRRAIKKFIQEQEKENMKRKVLRLSQSFNEIKGANLLMGDSVSRELVNNPLGSMETSKRWKIKSSYGDIGLKYMDDETVAYVAARMPAVYSACYRVLKEVRRRLPDFSPSRVLDFGSGPGSALWALRENWPHSLERVNLVEPSPAMLRASGSLLQDVKGLPRIQGYDSIQTLRQGVRKSDQEHDLVIASYVLGEIPSVKDRITVARQLWDLTRDVLVLIEPGTPQGSSIIRQMRSHILWMAKRKLRKVENMPNAASKDLMIRSKYGAFVVAPCAHDGPCPLENSEKYCHFVQRLERTSSQRAYKRSRDQPLRGFEDEKFCYVALRRGERPGYPFVWLHCSNRAAWPLDGMKFETLKERHAKRNPEDLEIDYEDQFKFDTEAEDVPYEEYLSSDASVTETDTPLEEEEEVEQDDQPADLGSGWGRIIFTPLRRGKQITMDVCRSTALDGSQGAFQRVVVTQSKNPTLHHQARRSLWGDLWPF
ncbi:hypothetical protein AMTRI_Chr09g22830 [Amborella trichopoda]